MWLTNQVVPRLAESTPRPSRIERERQPPGWDRELVSLLNLDASTVLAGLGEELGPAALGARPLDVGNVEWNQLVPH
jgi:hypothetical protein